MNAPFLPGEFGAQPNTASFVIGAETAHVINLGVQLKQGADAIEDAAAVHVYLSTDAVGDTPTAAADTIAIGTDGSIIGALIAHALVLVKSETSGHFDLNITEASAATYYAHLVLPSGAIVRSGALVFGG